MKPRHGLLGQVTEMSMRLSGSGPVRKRTISFCPSLLPGHRVFGLQASTRMLSISRHLVGIWASAPASGREKAARSNGIRRDIMDGNADAEGTKKMPSVRHAAQAPEKALRRPVKRVPVLVAHMRAR